MHRMEDKQNEEWLVVIKRQICVGSIETTEGVLFCCMASLLVRFDLTVEIKGLEIATSELNCFFIVLVFIGRRFDFSF